MGMSVLENVVKLEIKPSVAKTRFFVDEAPKGELIILSTLHFHLAYLERCSRLGNIVGWDLRRAKFDMLLKNVRPTARQISVYCERLAVLEKDCLKNALHRYQYYTSYFLKKSQEALQAANAEESVAFFNKAQLVIRTQGQIEARLEKEKN